MDEIKCPLYESLNLNPTVTVTYNDQPRGCAFHINVSLSWSLFYDCALRTSIAESCASWKKKFPASPNFTINSTTTRRGNGLRAKRVFVRAQPGVQLSNYYLDNI